MHAAHKASKGAPGTAIEDTQLFEDFMGE